MKYTQEQLEGMSNRDINKVVAQQIYSENSFIEKWAPGDDVFVFVSCKTLGRHGVSFDYCGNISDAWPIISENNICIEWGEGSSLERPTASNYNTPEKIESECLFKSEVLKAAMIVYLLMDESK